VIVAEGLSFSYGRRPVVDGVDLRVDDGRVVGLIGPNGSGKTTVLRLLYRSLRSSTGSVRVDGEAVTDLPARELARRLAVVIQEPAGDLPMTVSEMVALGRGPHLRTFQRTGARDHAVVASALEQVGVAHLADRSFTALSGGERQRVLVARALAQEADHLLLDEPTNHLDIRHQHGVLQLVRGLRTTTVVVLHDLTLAARYCDDLVLLDGGRVRARGPVHDVLEPEVIQDVYGIGVRRLAVDGEVHLLFFPATPSGAARRPDVSRTT